MIELYSHTKKYLDYFPGRLKYAELGKSMPLTFSVSVLITFVACSLRELQNFFIQPSP